MDNLLDSGDITEFFNRSPEIIQPEYMGARIIVLLIPPGKTLNMPRPKTASQLLTALGLREESAIVAREGKLLTPDRHIWPNDRIYVRKTASAG